MIDALKVKIFVEEFNHHYEEQSLLFTCNLSKIRLWRMLIVSSSTKKPHLPCKNPYFSCHFLHNTPNHCSFYIKNRLYWALCTQTVHPLGTTLQLCNFATLQNCKLPCVSATLQSKKLYKSQKHTSSQASAICHLPKSVWSG